MRYTQSIKATICMFLLLGIAALANAQNSAPSQGQEELDQVLEMMRQSGMSPEDIAQMEGMLGGLAEAEAQRKQGKLAQEQQAFDTANPGTGTAVVRADKSVYELRITKCEVTDSRNGIFRIYAQQQPGMADAELQLHSAGNGQAQSASFAVESPRRDNYNADNPQFAFDGTTATWSGSANGMTGRAQLSIEASCGDEAVYFDKPSQPAPNLGANSLVLYVDDEAHRFDIGYCSEQAVVKGRLKTVFAITATGTFRGRAAIVFLEKSEVPDIGEEFLSIDLQLGELTKEQRQLSPDDAELSVNGGMAIMNPDRFPSATSSRGMLTRDGRNVHYRGETLSTGDNDPEFADLSGYPEVFASCGG